MKKLSLSVWAIGACLLSISCQTTKILTANFEGDVIDAPPAKDLPGDPVGDFIEYNEALDPLLKVKSSTLSGTKALFFEYLGPVDVHRGGGWLSFKGKGTNLAETLWLWYTGEFSGARGEIFIELTDGIGVSITKIRIGRDGKVGLPRNADDYSTGEFPDIIGNIGSGRHTIIFKITPATLRYNISVLPGTGSPITGENKPMIASNALNFHNPAYPTLAIRHTEFSSRGNSYTIGSVTISRKEP